MEKIREIKKSDGPAVIKMAAEFAVFLDRLRADPQTPLDLRTYLRFGFGAERVFHGLIAEDGNKNPLGYMLFCYGFDTQFFRRYIVLEDLFVVGGARKRGLGKKLMDRLLQIARRRNCTGIRLSVWDRNPISVDFYKKLGYKDYNATHERYLMLEL
jgi:GNAT superfamily N-acetyltransferase